MTDREFRHYSLCTASVIAGLGILSAVIYNYTKDTGWGINAILAALTSSAILVATWMDKD